MTHWYATLHLNICCIKTKLWYISCIVMYFQNLPKSFVRANGLETSCGGEIVLMNEKGRPWTLVLKQKLSGTTYIRRGWRRFCIANRLKTGGVYTFKLIQSGRTPVLLLSSKESESESESEERNFGELCSLSY